MVSQEFITHNVIKHLVRPLFVETTKICGARSMCVPVDAVKL